MENCACYSTSKTRKNPYFSKQLQTNFTNKCKLMEKIVNSRLRLILEEKNLLDPMQFGFRTNRSTIDHLVKLQQEICD